MKKSLILLIFIMFLGTLLRFYKLGQVPFGFHRDEAFLGYNAYSLLKTGKDMSGHVLPLHFQSFLYSPAGYSYVSIPFIALFNLSPFSVRFASAFFGTLTIPLVYFLVKKIFTKNYNNLLPLSASFLLAISPWHINLSRTATENVVVVFFIIMGLLCYLEWRTKKMFLLLIATFIFWGITLIVYQAPRTFLPLFIPLIAIIFGPSYSEQRTFKLLAIMYIAIIIVPLLLIFSSPTLGLRLRTVSIFATEETQLTIDEQLREDGVMKISQIYSRIFHNKALGYIQQFLYNYFTHFSYEFIFTDHGLPDRYRVSGTGLLYLFELPFFILGILYLLTHSDRKRFFLIGWIAIAPIGSALTFDDVPNLQRTLISFPAIPIITALGFYVFWQWQQRQLTQLRYTVNTTLGILILFNIAFYLHQYYVHLPVHRPWFRHDGYKELVDKVNSLLPGYKKAIITNRESAPTIFFLFFNKYDPKTFQKEIAKNNIVDLDRINFSKYEFTQEECPLRIQTKEGKQNFTGVPDILYVNFGTCQTDSSLVNELIQIKRGDQSVVFKILKAL